TSATRLVTHVGALLAEGPHCVIVLDDLHELATDALDAVALLARRIPMGSQLVLSGRVEHTGLVPRRRVDRDLVEVGQRDLAVTASEARALLALWDTDISDTDSEQLHSATEGWPAGLYLAALALRAGSSLADAPTADRFVHDYLSVEHLSHLTVEERVFLRRSAALERMSPHLLDAALEREDGAGMLETLVRSNLFLVPLDRERRWYRYHDTFRAVLLDDLARTEPSLAGPIRRRAADWLEADGRLEEAMTYAVADGDTERIARLLLSLAFPLFREGRMTTLEAWLEHFEDAASLLRHPLVAALGALGFTLRGNAFRAERWLDAAGRAPDPGPLPDGSTGLGAWVAAIEALACRHGAERMRADAARALDELGPLTPLRLVALVAAAYGARLTGDTVLAERRFMELLDAAEATGGTVSAGDAASALALLALDRGELDRAQALVTRAFALVGGDAFAEYASVGLLHAARARVALALGDTETARGSLQAAQRLRPQLTHAMPYHSVNVLLELGRAHASLGEMDAVRALLVQVADVLRRRPDVGVLGDEVAALRATANGVAPAPGGWVPTLTAAELRLLPYLTTHLTFREIGERLFLSRNTVKTQAISAYRKLGASSRGEAVRRAAELGLVETHDPAFTPMG
ncbi:MAG: LuxR C-terminal-related transcriptional regulator, partial [Gaiella sp.]